MGDALGSAGRAGTSEKETAWCSGEPSVPARAGMEGQVCRWIGSRELSTAGGCTSVHLQLQPSWGMHVCAFARLGRGFSSYSLLTLHLL